MALVRVYEPDFWLRILPDDYIQISKEVRTYLGQQQDLVSWLERRVEHMTTQFEPTMSLAVSLIELKKGVKEFLPTLDDLKQSASGNFLKWKFGIMPFIKDLKDMCQVYGRFKKRLSFIKETQGQTFIARSKFNQEVLSPGIHRDVTTTLMPEPYQYPRDYANGVEPPFGAARVIDIAFFIHESATHFNVDTVSATWFLSGIITNMVAGLDDLSNQVEAFGRVLGLSNPAKIWWNILPWSWMVDWFADTDKILDNFDAPEPFEGKMVLKNLYLGSKVRTFGTVSAGCEHMNEPHLMGDFLVRDYMRNTDIDVGNLESSAFLTPSLNGGQSQILLALLDQRTKAIPSWADIYKKIRRGGFQR